MELEMSTERVKAVLEEATGLGCLTVRLTGGEPLLREDFSEIYMHARRLGMKVLLCTNGVLLKEELADLFHRYPPGEPVEVTLYGMTRERYEAVSREPGSFDAAMKGVFRLSERDISFRIRGVCFRGGDVDRAALEAFAKGRAGADAEVSFSLNFNPRARRDSREKNERIRRHRATPEETLAFLTRDKGAYILGKRAFAEKFMHLPGDTLFSCGCGQGGAVDAYGKFQPCLLLRHPDTVYDLGNGSMRDAMERFFQEMRGRKSVNEEYLATCARCFLHGMCEQCPAWSWMEWGELDRRVHYLCNVTHAQARYLGLLGQGEKAWDVENWQERIKEFCS
jgi:radical SAM protein with 4Fe4S-binding SPASM domain